MTDNQADKWLPVFHLLLQTVSDSACRLTVVVGSENLRTAESTSGNMGLVPTDLHNICLLSTRLFFLNYYYYFIYNMAVICNVMWTILVSLKTQDSALQSLFLIWMEVAPPCGWIKYRNLAKMSHFDLLTLFP